MTRCSACERHLQRAEAVCPFCGEQTRSLASRVFNVVASGATAVVLAACYGPPPGGWDDTAPPTDADGDGWLDIDDCDDNDVAINPDAEEICDDGVDNDCDGMIDADDEDCADTAA